MDILNESFCYFFNIYIVEAHVEDVVPPTSTLAPTLIVQVEMSLPLPLTSAFVTNLIEGTIPLPPPSMSTSTIVTPPPSPPPSSTSLSSPTFEAI